MTLTYRNGRPEDAGAVDRIFRTTFCDTFAHLYRKQDLDAFLSKFTPEAWLGELADHLYAFRIAEVGSNPIAYIKLGPVGLPVEPEGPAIELKQLYVLKEWHGAGIAQELIAWTLDEARNRGAREIYLSVYTDNHRARRFYERYGFEVQGPYAFMVGEQADEDLIMRLRL
jgi:ribosomal protein S18 acetylase RimI-like enzyme